MLAWLVGDEKAEWIAGKVRNSRVSRRTSDGDERGRGWKSGAAGSSTSIMSRVSSLPMARGFASIKSAWCRRESVATTQARMVLGAEWARVCEQLESISGGCFIEAMAKKLRRVNCDVEVSCRLTVVVVWDGHGVVMPEEIFRIFVQFRDQDKELVVVDTLRNAFFQKQAQDHSNVVHIPVDFKFDEEYRKRTDLPFAHVLKTIGYLIASGEEVMFLDNENLSARALGVNAERYRRLDVLTDLVTCCEDSA